MKVIKFDQLPVRIPWIPTMTLWLFFDRLHIPSWGWGVFWTIQAIIWIGCLIGIIKQELAEVQFK